MARAVPSPPPTTAEDSTASGHAAVTTTASRSIAISTPSIAVISPRHWKVARSPTRAWMPRAGKPWTSA